MTQSQTQTSDDASVSHGPTKLPPEALGLVIAWSPAEPGRLGEVCIVPSTRPGVAFVLGRGPATPGDELPRLDFVRNRAGVVDERPALSSPKISREQLWIQADGVRALDIRNIGRCPLLHNGEPVTSATILPGDTLQLGQELLLLCVRRRAWIHSLDGSAPSMPFGHADRYGVVGESPSAWELRRQIAFVARRPDHVLIVGESGTGKELAARAVHTLSPRAAASFVARNAATFPEGLVDAELFGHAKNYPNAGMAERQGLVGEAAGATLFLDEIAELSPTLQTHLLRVLDKGEYQRLGESVVRTSDFRFIAATNDPGKLREDLVARLKLLLRTPGLNERLEDIPLLVVHLLRHIAKANSDIAARIFPDEGPDGAEGEPRVALGFMDALLRRHYRTHVRELEGLLWRALAEGPEQVLDGTLRGPSEIAPRTPSARPSGAAPKKPLSPREVEGALIENEWSLERTWRALGLTSRHSLSRLVTKYGLRRPKP